MKKPKSRFSSETGLEAKRAYETLIAIGEKLPQARSFQEFLIFITWQQATEETIPCHFHKGVQLTEHFLARFGSQVRGATCTSVSSRYNSPLNEGWAIALNQCRTNTIGMRLMATIDRGESKF
ncbi:MAG: hypothetical protein OXI86_13865 [Candidatus Poribacteria bacterium]|nr:hypothetical protein [Candidatus Poribacteria bacterium]